MFSGEIPFHADIVETRVILGVIAGKRPERPLDDVSKTRGLNDDVWKLVKACWAQDPTDRPRIVQVIGQLRALAGLRIDERKLDNLSLDLPLYDHTKHPFAALITNNPVPFAPRRVEQPWLRLPGDPLDPRREGERPESFSPTAADDSSQPQRSDTRWGNGIDEALRGKNLGGRSAGHNMESKDEAIDEEIRSPASYLVVSEILDDDRQHNQSRGSNRNNLVSGSELRPQDNGGTNRHMNINGTGCVNSHILMILPSINLFPGPS
jgi:hypothetical protein